jgi:hypothetical protein
VRPAGARSSISRARAQLGRHKRAAAGGAAGMVAAGLLGVGGGHLAGHHHIPPSTPSASSQPIASANGEGGGALIGHCGVERWPVKTGTDADAGLVSLSPVQTTIALMVSLHAPSNPPNASRVAPAELTDFTISATLTGFKLEADNDYHLVISDGTRTMIVEIPNPGCVGSGSPFRPQISQARAKFDSHYVAAAGFQSVSVAVTVTGIGFFDRIHGQTGVAPNGIELHPVLNIDFP